jgi:hypothetical protein
LLLDGSKEGSGRSRSTISPNVGSAIRSISGSPGHHTDRTAAIRTTARRRREIARANRELDAIGIGTDPARRGGAEAISRAEPAGKLGG